LSVVLHAALTVYVGSWRSVKAEPPAESMTHKDAMKFPIVSLDIPYSSSSELAQSGLQAVDAAVSARHLISCIASVTALPLSHH